jgi:hypothetical protein
MECLEYSPRHASCMVIVSFVCHAASRNILTIFVSKNSEQKHFQKNFYNTDAQRHFGPALHKPLSTVICTAVL